ncbi:hypothetical protein POTOM_040066 [Populus tomentosa]|uniref:Ankyrin repeat family protein n=1 Tax=Populus tomentosa TaxID=118781 RepID=A0A8X7YTR3_POPTO|nr:hypothetical protein POTOM_040066 [Populus tomentosa]
MNRITYIDHILYKAAAEGNIDPFENCETCLDQLLTPDENTILHVYLRNQTREPESTDFVDKILEMFLIDRAKALPADPESGVTEAKRMLRMTNVERHTALHEAARSRGSHVVEILTAEDPEFSYSANVHGEPPLYIAVLRGGKEIDEILGNCISVDYGGPNGGTALHAASSGGHDVMSPIIFSNQTINQSIFLVLLVSGTARKILDCYPSAAYIADTKKKRTALHIAAIHGNVNAVKEIVSRCPASCELVDDKGWNALHYAVASQTRNVLEECLQIPELARLKTEKDDKGNTPFHLIAALAHKQKQWRRVLDEHRDEFDSDIFGLNKRKLRVDDLLFINFAELKVILSL